MSQTEPQDRGRCRQIPGAALISLALVAAGVLPLAFPRGAAARPSWVPARESADSPAVRLTVAQVRERLAAGTASAPPDLSAADLSGLDLHGVDFKQANLTK